MAQWTQSEAYTNIERFIIRLRDASTRSVSESEVAAPFYVVFARTNADVAAFLHRTARQAGQCTLEKVDRVARRIRIAELDREGVPSLAQQTRSGASEMLSFS